MLAVGSIALCALLLDTLASYAFLLYTQLAHVAAVSPLLLSHRRYAQEQLENIAASSSGQTSIHKHVQVSLNLLRQSYVPG